MISIPASAVTPALLALFDTTKPTMMRAFNVLEGRAVGQILADHAERPAWAAVREASYGTLYLGGRFSAPVLAAVIAHLLQLGPVGIGCWLDDPVRLLLPPNPDYAGRTLYFPRRDPQVALEPLLPALPAEYQLVARDASLFEQSLDREETLATFGSVENVLRLTLGVMLLHDDLVVCEAATGAPTHGRIEIGVSTREAYRRRGFASRTCARLVLLCEARGHAVWWDCAKQNTASIQLARRLGFRDEQEYQFVYWAKRSDGAAG